MICSSAQVLLFSFSFVLSCGDHSIFVFTIRMPIVADFIVAIIPHTPLTYAVMLNPGYVHCLCLLQVALGLHVIETIMAYFSVITIGQMHISCG